MYPLVPESAPPDPPVGAAPDIIDADDDLIRVLVVDDQPRNLEAISALFDQSGCVMVCARSADEALLALLRHEFAAIILDVKMPGMSGLELAELIKERRRTSHVPILFLTAHMLDEREVLRGYGSGAVDYLSKPVPPAILKSKIAVFVDLFRKTRELRRANDALRREVQERERAQEALHVANQELEQRVLERTGELQQADRRKDEFLASLAHELRNPLAPVRLAVEVLQAPNVPTEHAVHARGVIVRQVEHMRRLIDDLLDVSRITSGKLMLRRSLVDLSEVVAAAIETSRPLMIERRHTLAISLPDPPVALDADAARLSQVLSNLLTNAAKYTTTGGRVRLSAEASGPEVVMRVTDNGIGIRPDLLPHIFELFTQGQRAEESPEGLGVGLTLARKLIELHGGTIEARSAGADQGAEFTIRLPVVPVPVRSATTRPSLDHPAHASRRILVVDDNRDAAEMLSVMLTSWGHRLRVTYNGLEALEAGPSVRPEIVLLDLGLPGLDGYDTARHIRGTPWGKHVLLIAVTGWGQASDIERGRQAGFDHHLVKPVAPEILRALIAAVDLPHAADPGRPVSSTGGV